MTRPFYSITINGKNTWDDFGMMPVKAGRIEFATPSLKYEAAEVAGSNDVLDFTEALTGYPLYNQREGSLTFRFFDNGISVRSRFQNLKNFLHGRKVRAIIEDAPDYYYEGRFQVGELTFASRGNWADVELSYILNAYKIQIGSTVEDWLWDPFDLENGIIREYGSIAVTGQTTVTVIGSRKPTSPKFIVDSDMVMVVNGTSYDLTTGSNIFPQLVLQDEEYSILFKGIGTVTIDMTVGSL